MATDFPNSPANGATHTFGGTTYTYSTSVGAWTAGSSAGGGASVTVSETAPSSPAEGDLWFDPSVLKTFVYYNDGSANQWVQSNPTGSGGGGGAGASVTASETAPSSPSPDDLWFDTSSGTLYFYYADGSSNQWVGVSGPAGADGAAGANATPTSYTNLAGFPSSGNTLGNFAVAQDTKALYMWDGTQWERVDNGDESPVITTEPPTATQSLNSDGTTSTVTMVAQDPEGFDITYGIAYKTANNARPAQLSADTTINQSTGVFTFTPSTTTSDAGSFRARLSASDGARITTRFVDFDLGFYPAESALLARYEFYDTNCYNPSTSTTALNDNSGNGNNQTISNPGTHTGSGNMTFNSNTTITFTGLNATKAWFVLYYPPSGWNQGILFGSGGSTYYATFKSGNTSNYYGTSAYSAHSGATIVDRVNGTNPTNRGVAYSAMDISAMNSIINSGTDMSPSLAYQQYSGWTPTHYVRAMVFFDREITLTEMEALHNHYRTNWLAAGGTMPTWGN